MENQKDRNLSEGKTDAVTMDPHKQRGHGKVALALEGTLAVLNNQIKHFLLASQLKQASKQTSAQVCSDPLKYQLLFNRKNKIGTQKNTEYC